MDGGPAPRSASALSPVPPNEELPDRRVRSDPNEGLRDKFECAWSIRCVAGRWHDESELYMSSDGYHSFVCAACASECGGQWTDAADNPWSLADELAYRRRVVDLADLVVGAVYKVAEDENGERALNCRWDTMQQFEGAGLETKVDRLQSEIGALGDRITTLENEP